MTKDKLQMTNIGNWILGIVFCLVIGIWLLGFTPEAQAASFKTTGNPDDTLSGTIITAEAANETLNYTDINGNPKPQVIPPSDIKVTVLPVYGFSGASIKTPINTGPGIGSNHIYPGQTRYTYFVVTNEGNVSDTYYTTHEADFTNAGTGWLVEVWRTASNTLVGTLEPGSNVTSEAINMAEDADFRLHYKFIAPFPSTPEAKVKVTMSALTSNTPTGQYTGANGLTYGGIGSMVGTSEQIVARPFMILTRTTTVDAPKATVGFTGGAHAKVPGSIITNVMTYSNAGNCSAESVIIVDRVPNSTNLACINKRGDTDNVTIEVTWTSAWPWMVSYSTIEAPQKNYGDLTDWTLVGTMDGSAIKYFPDGTATYSLAPIGPEFYAKWVKFERSDIPSGEANKSLGLGFTIR